jgi:hypothetical protein
VISIKSKKIIVSTTSLILVSQLFLGSTQAFAQTPTPSPTQSNFFQGLVNFISQKFGLDKTQVQSAVQQYQKQNEPNGSRRIPPTADELKAMEKNRLDKLVTDGKITAEQENLIIQEMNTLHSKYNLENMKNLSMDDRKKQMDAMQAEIKTWASANNIDAKYLMFGRGGMMGPRMHGGNKGDWNKPNVSPTP